MAAPVIRTVTAGPTVLFPGQSTTVAVDAYHPDSRLLTFPGRVSDPTGVAWDTSVRLELGVPLTFQLTSASAGVTVTPSASEPTRFTVTVLSGRGTVTLTATVRDATGRTATAALPELPALDTGKFVDAPSAVLHVSWKDDVEQLGSWLDGLSRPVYLTWHHEPMGDVTPATYRATGARA